MVNQLNRPTSWMVDLLDHVARKHCLRAISIPPEPHRKIWTRTVLMIERPLNIVDSGVRHTTALENIKPFLRSFRLKSVLYATI
jgi:hypothetical protein